MAASHHVELTQRRSRFLLVRSAWFMTAIQRPDFLPPYRACSLMLRVNLDGNSKTR